LIDCRPTASDVRTVLDAWAGRRLDTLRFDHTKLDDDGYALLATHPATGRLRTLMLEGRYPPTSPRGAWSRLLAGPSLGHLNWLTLSESLPTADDLDALLSWPGLRRLRSLILSDLGLDDEFVTRLAANPNVRNLRKLMLGNNPIGDVGAEALITSPHLDRRLALSVYGTPADSDEFLTRQLKRRFKSV
jgi:hypothetical protein